MAAHSPPSPLPPPSARQLGPWSPCVGWGAVVHAVRSEPSVLAGAEREGVVDKSDISWRGEEGSGGRRGPVGAPPARAPLLSAPSGARRIEGISVEEAMVTRTQLLEEELSSVKEELALCQVSRGRWPFSLHGGAGAVGRHAPLSLCLRPRGARVWAPANFARRPHPPRPVFGAVRTRQRLAPRPRAPVPLLTPAVGVHLGDLGLVFFNLDTTKTRSRTPHPAKAQVLSRDSSGTWCRGMQCSPQLQC